MQNLTRTGIVFFLAILFPLFGSGIDHAAAAICPGGTPCVNSTDIIDGQVANADLANNAVNSAKIQDGTVTGTDIQDGSVGSADLASGAVTSAKIATGAVGSTQISDGSVGSADLASGAVTSAKIATGAVGSTQISDGSVASADVGFNYAGSASKGGPASDLSCTACVSKSELDATVFPAQRVVVASSGGDYTTISAALAAITPSSTTPYVIDVMPGTYTENVTMKSYVHLRGAGREVTTVQSPSTSSSVISLSSVASAAISGLTVKGGLDGISVQSSSATIADNTITGNSNRGIYNFDSSPRLSGNLVTLNSSHGIYSTSASSPVIMGNSVTGNGGIGIYSDSSASPVITGNTISGNSGSGIQSASTLGTISGNIVTANGNYGVLAFSSAATVTGNTITGNTFSGVSVASSSSATIINNRITGNGTADTDIFVNADSTPNISFNVYDDISGTTGVGQYNVNSNGDPAPAP